MKQEKNCAFQYAKVYGSYFRNTEMVCDKTNLTLDEAKDLWNKYYPDLAKFIKEGNSGEMVIWINMNNDQDFRDKLEHICEDAESDGINIWENRRIKFTKEFKVINQ